MLEVKLEQPLERRFHRGDSTMSPLTHLVKFAAGGAILALSAANHTANADELVQILGPVGPYETILTTVGNKRVIAFYELDNGRCAIQAVIYDKTDPDTGMTTAARVRVSLKPREIVHIDGNDNETLNLQCGDYAESLGAIDADHS
jgi:hypothetical protein